MKAAFLYNKMDLRVMDVAIPEIGDSEILLKVKSASICGTDVRMHTHGYRNVDEKNLLLLGHEVSGTIHAVGSKFADRYHEGMRVAVAPNMGCSHCDLCVSGNPHRSEERRVGKECRSRSRPYQ